MDPVQRIECTIADAKHRLDILQDPDPLSPREAENLGVMLYTHRKYVLGDEKIPHASFEEYLESAQLDASDVVSLPLYLLDHSGLRMKTTSFNDPWDSMCVGVIYTTTQKIAAEWGDASAASIELAKTVLAAEVDAFDDYLSGNIYGFSHTVFDPKAPAGDGAVGAWVERDSCWGFHGSDPLQNGMKDHFDGDWGSAMIQQLSPKPKFK